jgi:hypothetical protein
MNRREFLKGGLAALVTLCIPKSTGDKEPELTVGVGRKSAMIPENHFEIECPKDASNCGDVQCGEAGCRVYDTSLNYGISPLTNSLKKWLAQEKQPTGILYGCKPYTCNRCGKIFYDDIDPDVCWYCQSDLCENCWEEYGHCGHPKAERQNELARQFDTGQVFDDFVEATVRSNKFLLDEYERTIDFLENYDSMTNQAMVMWANEMGREPLTTTEKQQAWLNYVIAKNESEV